MTLKSPFADRPSPMRIIVNDTSCLIDLRKAGLLHAALLLPFQFQIALPLIATELLDFTPAEIADLQTRGLEVIDLGPDQVGRAFEFRGAYAALSIYDCFSMSLAESTDDAILLTGDRNLRTQATALGLEVHGVLWVSDRLEESQITAYADIHEGLLRLQSDPLVFLPTAEIEERIRRLRRLLGIR